MKKDIPVPHIHFNTKDLSQDQTPPTFLPKADITLILLFPERFEGGSYFIRHHS
jgi:hypothetical protein